ELRYQNRAYAYFQPIIRRAHALSPDEVASLIDDALDAGRLTKPEAADLALADVIVRGRMQEDGREVYLVVEVSVGVGSGDVRRASDRAALLAKLGFDAIPVVAGERVVDDAHEIAQAQRVWQVTDGHVVAPPGA